MTRPTPARSAPAETQPATHAADRLLDAIDRCGSPVCVGLDPVLEKLPKHVLKQHPRDAHPIRIIGGYCVVVLDAIKEIVPCVKIQSACFERYHERGYETLWFIISLAKDLGFEVILDAKRGDIGVSAEHYAASAAGHVDQKFGVCSADWITINSYLGEDGIMPFLVAGDRGAFALVRTSNAGGDAIQNLQLKDGRTVAQAVASLIADIGADHTGGRGFSSLGAVVGATKAAEAAKLRDLMPQQIFLVPGYGAQGGTIDDIKPCFHSNGTGAIVTASRSVIYAFDPDSPTWAESVRKAAKRLADEVGRAVGMR